MGRFPNFLVALPRSLTQCDAVDALPPLPAMKIVAPSSRARRSRLTSRSTADRSSSATSVANWSRYDLKMACDETSMARVMDRHSLNDVCHAERTDDRTGSCAATAAPISSEQVAAGDGALYTLSDPGPRVIRKSSTSWPSARRACAR